MKMLICVAFVNLFSLLSYAQTVVDPSLHWQELRSPHFHLLFDAQHEPQARHYLEVAELAHNKLIGIFKESPEYTTIILWDGYDQPNGSAQVFPRPQIYAFPALPSGLDSLGYYGDWAQELITHEYTHILNMEPTHGIPKALSTVFGSIIKPSMLLPNWYAEGLAVYMETQWTDHGRLHSPTYMAMLRSFAMEPAEYIENMGTLNEVSTPIWPFGQRPYFFGSLLIEELAHRYKSDELFYLLNDRYASRMPFFLNAPIEDYLQKNYQQIWSEFWLQKMTEAQAELTTLKQTPYSEDHLFNVSNSRSVYAPSLSPDQQKLIFISASLENDDEIYLVDRGASSTDFSTLPAKLLTTGKEVQRLSWLPNSQKFIYEKTNDYHQFYEVSDLYLYDLANHRGDRLTEGERAREAHVSPDGKNIVFVSAGAGSTQLKVLNLETKKVQNLFQPAWQERVSSPVFADSQNIYFLRRDLAGKEHWQQLTITQWQPLQTNATELPLSLSSLQNINFISSCQCWLATSEQSGVSNVYRFDSHQKDWLPITNTPTALAQPEYDPITKQLIEARLTSKGYQLAFEPNDLQPKKITALPVNTSRAEKNTEKKSATTTTAITQSEPATDYLPWRYLFPQYFRPTFLNFSSSGTSAGLLTSGNDPLDIHNYSLSAQYDSYTARPSEIATYTYRTAALDYDLSATHSYIYLQSDRLIEHDWLTTIFGSFYLPGLSNNYRSGVGWTYQNTDFDPSVNTYFRSGPTAFFSFSNTEKRGFQISPESGLEFYLQETYYLPQNTTSSYGRTSMIATNYFSKWLPRHHVLRSDMQFSATDHNGRSIRDGVVVGGGEYSMIRSSNYFNVRGYPISEFTGWSMLSTSFEYRFPLLSIFQGDETRPWFFKQLHAALFYDALTADGAYADTSFLNRSTKFWTFYPSTGMELLLDTTLGYRLPVTFRFGYHQGLNTTANGANTLFIGMRM